MTTRNPNDGLMQTAPRARWYKNIETWIIIIALCLIGVHITFMVMGVYKLAD